MASEETTPFLPSQRQDTETNGEASRPTWQFWRTQSDALPKRQHASIVSEPESLEREEGKMTRRRRLGWALAIEYGILLALGLGVGILFGRRLARRNEIGDGPMVTPIYELPKPSFLPRNPSYMADGTHGAVASEDTTCSNLGLTVLRDMNGTAVDAAITTTLCIGLLNAFASGVGGGGFMVVHVPDTFPKDDPVWEEAGTHGVVAIDFRETSPKGSEKEMYGSNRAGRVAAQVGGMAVGVPGELRGLEMAYRMYGTIPWSDLVMPVAEMAKGYQISREAAKRLRVFGQFMLDNPVWANVYAPRKRLLVEGEWTERIEYGKTLEKIAQQGPSAFYEGDVAENMIGTLQSLGGVMTLDDLKDYEARVYPAVHQTYHGRTLYTTTAPSSGGVMLGLLNILEPFTRHQKPDECWTPLWTHRLIEAMKFAFGARSEITDPAFAKDLGRLDEFYTKSWADEVRGKITDNNTHGVEYYGLQHDTPVDHGTMHLSVADRFGGAVSITSTVNLIWGSHVMCEKTGVIFNDEQDDFAVPGAADAFGLLPSPWNYPAPGKRPLSSTAATIILNPDKSLNAVIGGSGGSRIFGSIVQVLLNLDCGLDLQQAINRVRIHNQVVPQFTTIEVGPEGVDEELIDGLKGKGHEIKLFDVNVGAAEVQAILVENGTFWASSDSRKNGVAAAY